MNSKCRGISILALLALLVSFLPTLRAGALQDSTTSAQDSGTAPKRVVGTITAIQGNSLTLRTDLGDPVTVTASDRARVVQTVPGQKDLTGATPIHLSDLNVGDRVLARATLGSDGKTYLASTLISIRQADVAQKQVAEREAWQRSGEGGLVKAVDPAAQTITIAVMSAGGPKTVLVHTTPSTINRRYAADSVEFNEAKPAPLDQIKVGDQLRGRGTRNADNSELQADEIVSGTFRNVVATVSSVDAAAGTVTGTDLVAKTPVVIRVTHDSQLRKLPEMLAQGLAMRLKNSSGGSTAADGQPRGQMMDSGRGGAGRPSATDQTGGRSDGAGGRSPASGAGAPAQAPDGAGAPRTRGPGDLQQALSSAPAIQLTDLHKGDAIMVVTTEGSAATPATAVTLLAGVEPMLQASATGTRSMLSASWNLNSPGEGTP